MSLILKGIDMPKDIDELRLIINGMSIAIEPTQAIQIDRPHGRLGDLDELANKCDEPSWCVWLNEIDDAPTILEAEG